MLFRRRIRTRTLRQRRRRMVVDGIALLVALAGAVVLLLSQLSMIAPTSVQTIEVKGNEVLTDRQLTDAVRPFLHGHYLGLFARDHILLYPRLRIERAIRDTFPRIRTVDVDLENLHTISVTVEERDTLVHFCTSEDTCYLVDIDGFIFAPAARLSGSTTFVYLQTNATTTEPIGTHVLPSEDFTKLQDFVREARMIGIRSDRVRIETPDRFALVLADGGDILFDPADGYPYLLENLRIIFNAEDLQTTEHIEYIDLRFGNKIFYKVTE